MANPVTFGRVKYLQADTNVHTAWALRPGVYGKSTGGVGVAGYNDFLVIQRQAGANMTVDVGVASGGIMEAWVPGTNRTSQGLYSVINIDWTAPTTSAYVAQLNATVGANASGNPRIDMVVLEVLDSQHAGTSAVQQVHVVAGTPTGGATLDNRTGAAAQPANSILLADIVVANGAASIVTANIRDRRPFAILGSLPVPTNATVAAVDAVLLQPAPGLVVSNATLTTNANTDQVAALVYLPRRIVGASRMRWKYVQNGSTAATGNYAAAIFDASGRLVIGFGSTAFTGATSSVQVRSETITATTFEAGWYYLFWTFSVSAGSAMYVGVDGTVGVTIGPGAQSPNAFFGGDAAGFSTPTTLSALNDIGALTSAVSLAPVPLVTLSVG